jgi:hypothetical protein
MEKDTRFSYQGKCHVPLLGICLNTARNAFNSHHQQQKYQAEVSKSGVYVGE